MSETGYVKATEVQGDSFEVGAKVVYQGREMVVSSGIDSDGEIKMTDSSGLKVLAEVLPQTSITSLKCAASDCARYGPISPLLAFCDAAETLAMSAQPLLQQYGRRGHGRARQGAARHDDSDPRVRRSREMRLRV